MAAIDANRLLLLVPTAMERSYLEAAFTRCGEAGRIFRAAVCTQTCGFGLVASAAMTMRHLHDHSPSHVVLAGIAGSLSSKCEVGGAYWFDEVVCDGIGVGSDDDYLSAALLGWNHVDEDASGQPVGDRLGLHVPQSQNLTRHRCGLISRCAASANATAASSARRRAEETCDATGRVPMHPFAAEDMEGFAVALACRIAGVPLSIVRGISNEAGDRNHAAWQITPAMEAVAKQLMEIKLSTS